MVFQHAEGIAQYPPTSSAYNTQLSNPEDTQRKVEIQLHTGGVRKGKRGKP